MKYYKAEDVIEIFSDESRPYNWMGTDAEIQEQVDFDFYKSQIESLPTIEIVRCGDCMYWHKNRKEEDDMNVLDVCYDFQDDDFCSYGERIEE